jgi:superfamily II DNA or RNA helicase
LEDLTITPKETKYGKGEPFYLFDVEIEQALLPFSYAYYHAEKLSLPEYPNENIEFKKTENPYTFTGTLNDIQEGVKREVFEILNRTHSILISLFCGAGKTCLATFLASKLHYPTCILSHRVTIIDQWKYSIGKFCPKAKVQVLTTKNKMKEGMDFYIMNTSSVAKRKRSDFKDIGVLIIDEAHTICTPGMSQSLFSFCPKYLIGLTATPKRSDEMDKLLDIYFGPDIISRKLYRPFNVYLVPTNFSPKSKTNKSGDLDWTDIMKQQTESPERNQIILNMILYFKTRTFLVLCKRKTQTNFLFSELKKRGEDVDMFVASAKKFNYDSRILISTYAKTSVGFDHPHLNALIIASDIEEGIEQTLGRVAARSSITPMVLELRDKFRPFTKHLGTRIKCYERTGGEMKPIGNAFPEFNLK